MRVILEESQTFEEYFLMSSKKGKWRYEDCDYVIVNQVQNALRNSIPKTEVLDVLHLSRRCDHCHTDCSQCSRSRCG